MIVDMTGYFGPWSYWKIPITRPEQLLKAMDAHRIDRLAVVSTQGISGHSDAGNDDVLRLAAAYPGRFVPFATLGGGTLAEPASTASALERLRRYRQRGVAGLRIFPQHQSYPLHGDYYMDPVLAEAAKLGMILMVHVRAIMNWGMPEYPVAEIARLAERFPSARVVLCGVNGEWREAVTAMKRHANMMIETSCLQYVDMIPLFTREFGSKRVLFGSGLALQYPQCGLVKVMKAKITEAERADILGGNAARLLG